MLTGSTSATSDLELNLPQWRCWGGSASAARPGTAMRKRSRRPDLVSPFAVDFFAYPLRSVNAHPIAQVNHPVALNHHVRILQQVLRVDRPEVALAGPEHDGYDVHAHLVDQTCGEHLATDVASSDLDSAVTRKLLRLGHGRLDAVDEVKRRLGVPALGRRPVRHDDHVVDRSVRRGQPVSQLSNGEAGPKLIYRHPPVTQVGRPHPHE